MTKFKYPYTQRNLFEEPERYFYAQCDNKDFYSSWLTSRYASLQLLNDIPSKINSHLAYSSAFLTGMMSDIGEQMDDREIAETALEPLVKKFEIFRRFFTQYDDGKSSYNFRCHLAAVQPHGGRSGCNITNSELNCSCESWFDRLNVNILANVSPHVILYVFLPPLIFER